MLPHIFHLEEHIFSAEMFLLFVQNLLLTLGFWGCRSSAESCAKPSGSASSSPARASRPLSPPPATPASGALKHARHLGMPAVTLDLLKELLPAVEVIVGGTPGYTNSPEPDFVPLPSSVLLTASASASPVGAPVLRAVCVC